MTRTMTADGVELTPGEHLLVIGPACSGKSRLLDRLASEWDGDVVRIDGVMDRRSPERSLREQRSAVAERTNVLESLGASSGGQPRLVIIDHLHLGRQVGEVSQSLFALLTWGRAVGFTVAMAVQAGLPVSRLPEDVRDLFGQQVELERFRAAV